MIRIHVYQSGQCRGLIRLKPFQDVSKNKDIKFVMIFVIYLLTNVITYQFSVITMLACPMMYCNALGFIPAFAILVQNVCLMVWGVITGGNGSW